MDFTLNEQEEAIRTMASKFAKVNSKKLQLKLKKMISLQVGILLENLQSKVYLGLIFKLNTVEVVLGTSKQY